MKLICGLTLVLLFTNSSVAKAGFFKNVYNKVFSCRQALKRPDYVTYDTKNKRYLGLTPEGIQFLREQRALMLERKRIFNHRLRNLQTVQHAIEVARLHKAHVLLHGGPGAAKSLTVNHILDSEEWASFKIQLNQMMTEDALIGGRNFEKAKKGEYSINTSKRLPEYVTGLVDEVEKGNPAALAALLSLLNERKVFAGSEEIAAKLETLFVTSNSNLAEFLDHFRATGQGSTGPALLNRFLIKVYVFNWLGAEDMLHLTELDEEKRLLEAMAQQHPEVSEDKAFERAPSLDWDGLRGIATALFGISEELKIFHIDQLTEMRSQTRDAVIVSEEDPNVADKVPTVEYTERMRGQALNIIRMSAFVDFLQSPLSNDDEIEQNVSQRIMLDRFSLWRLHLMLTTVSSGEAKLELKIGVDDKPNFNINFGWLHSAEDGKDVRERDMIQHMIDEQSMFESTYLNILDEYKKQLSSSSEALAPGQRSNLDDSFDDWSFELALIQARGAE